MFLHILQIKKISKQNHSDFPLNIFSPTRIPAHPGSAVIKVDFRHQFKYRSMTSYRLQIFQNCEVVQLKQLNPLSVEHI